MTVHRDAGSSLPRPASEDEASVAVELALLDTAGVIVSTNAACDTFCLENDGDPTRAGVGVFYLEACAAAEEDPGATVTLSRVSAVSTRTGSADLIPALLRLTKVMAAEQGLTQTLQRVAESARDLLGLSFVAIGMTGEVGSPRLVHAGIDGQSIAGLPAGSGVIEWFAARPRFLRFSVPVDRPHNAVLYVADELPGSFTAAQEHLAARIADAAGIAIANARLYQASDKGHRWAEAAAELTHDFVTGDPAGPLDLVLRHAARAAEADLAAILVPEDAEHIRLHAIVGAMEGVGSGKLFPREGSPAAEVMDTGEPLLLVKPTARLDEVSHEPMGPMAVVPLTARQAVIGVLVVSRVIERTPFTAADLAALSRFTSYAEIALGLDKSGGDREALRVHDDRARIAIELHDHVVRHLFAVGMGLEGLIAVVEDAELRGRIAGYVTELDESIRAIRETIYQVRD